MYLNHNYQKPASVRMSGNAVMDETYAKDLVDKALEGKVALSQEDVLSICSSIALEMILADPRFDHDNNLSPLLKIASSNGAVISRVTKNAMFDIMQNGNYEHAMLAEKLFTEYGEELEEEEKGALITLKSNAIPSGAKWAKRAKYVGKMIGLNEYDIVCELWENYRNNSGNEFKEFSSIMEDAGFSDTVIKYLYNEKVA